jgi:PAS domain S-box-containing protein
MAEEERTAADAGARTHRDLQEKVAQQSAIAALGQRALEGLDTVRLARIAVELVTQTLGADCCSLFELQADGEHVLRLAGLGFGEELPGSLFAVADKAMTRRALTTHEAVVVEDMRSSEFGKDPWTIHFGITSCITVPIPAPTGVFGAIGVYSVGQRRYCSIDLDFLRSIANILAQAAARNRAEVDLRKSEIYFRTLIENISDLISVVDSEGRLLFTSKAGAMVFGRQAESVLGRSVLDLHHPDYAERMRRAYGEALRRPNQSVTVESRVRHDEGEWIDCEITLQATTSLQGRPVLVSTLRDITERKRAERELSLLALIVGSSDDAISSRDLEGRVMSWNPGAERLYGYKASEVLGQQRDSFHQPEQAAEMRERLAELQRTGKPQHFETQRLRKDGSMAEVSVKLSPLYGQDGRILGFAAISRDITERKLAERARELARSNAELEQFAYVAAHDLKEPLRVMGIYAQLLKRRLGADADNETLKFLGYIEDSARRGQELNDALLAYARVAPKAASITSVDCAAVLKGVLRDLNSLIQTTGAEITCDALPTIMADRTLFAHLLQNLISNGLRFRSDEPPRLHVGLRRAAGEWIFCVRDNGIGIDPRYHARIFEMFKRLHGRDRYPGTGIGLAICKKAAEKLGGRIWVESTLGHGASFYFTVPILEPPVTPV